jgi:hypothetical protein
MQICYNFEFNRALELTQRNPAIVPCQMAKWLQLWTIMPIELSTYPKYRRIYVQLNIEACISRNVITLDLTGTRDGIA